jgi:N-acetylglucosamine malate deacetylase 1
MSASTRSVVIVAPHPDDDLIGAGGSLLLHARAGAQVVSIHVIGRERSRLDENVTDEQFAAETELAATRLGVTETVSLNGSSRDFSLSRDLRLALVAILRRARPDVVYLPHRDESDQEHRQVHDLAIDALWMASSGFFHGSGPDPMPRPGLVLGYEVWTAMRRYQYAEDISSVIDEKVDAMRAYKSQLRHVAWDEAIRGLAAYRGAVALGYGYAEAFEVIELRQPAVRPAVASPGPSA